MGMHIGTIVETLINIKDRGKGCLTGMEVEALNDACNILDKCFLRFDTKQEVVDNTITTIRWKREDVRSCLVEDGYEGTEENVDKVLADKGLFKDIDNTCIEAGWGPIHSRIYDLGSRGLGTRKEVGDDAETSS